MLGTKETFWKNVIRFWIVYFQDCVVDVSPGCGLLDQTFLALVLCSKNRDIWCSFLGRKVTVFSFKKFLMRFFFFFYLSLKNLIQFISNIFLHQYKGFFCNIWYMNMVNSIHYILHIPIHGTFVIDKTHSKPSLLMSIICAFSSSASKCIRQSTIL